MNLQFFDAILRKKPAFVQFLNREILNIYGYTAALNTERLYSWALRLSRYAILASRDSLILPASYLFEVPFIDRYLNRLSPLQDTGLLRIASPNPDLVLYAEKKRLEYREELTLFPDYEELTPKWKNRPDFLWTPRTERSASSDISFAWRSQLEDRGLWHDILAKRAGKFSPLSSWETIIEKIPDRLERRAFIRRFAEPLLPFKLEGAERSQLGMLISRAYLESYLLELDAFVICDTPLGMLDCGLPRVNMPIGLLTFPFRDLRRVLVTIGVERLFEEVLGWRQITQLIDFPVINWLVECTIVDHLLPGHLMDDATLNSRYRRYSPSARDRRTGDTLAIFLDEVHRFYDHVSAPFADLQSKYAAPIGEPPAKPVASTQLIILGKEFQVSPNSIFLVHGRDSRAVNSTKAILRAAGLSPLDWEQAVEWTGKASPFTLEVVRAGLDHTQATVVLFTPDESAELRSELLSGRGASTEEGFQPRPNVLIEAGMAIALKPERTIILMAGTNRPVSDLAGLNYIRFDGGPEQRHALLKRLRSAGCEPEESGDFFTIPFESLGG